MTYLGLGSALPLLILGALLLFLRPHRSAQVFFALFTVTFGLQLAVLNAGSLLGDAATQYRLYLVAHALMPVATLFLVHFSMVVRPRPYSRYVTTAAVLIAFAASLTLAFRPDLIVASVQPTEWGPLNLFLFQGPQRLALFGALVVMYLEYRAAKAGTPRRRIRGILLALALLNSYRNTALFAYNMSQPGQLTEFASGTVITAGGWTDRVEIALLVLLFCALLGITLHIILRPPPPEGMDSPLVFAFLFPSLVAGMELLLAPYGIPFETRGFWEILAVGVLVYTLANYQMFGLELQMRRFAGPLVASILVLFGIPTLLTMALGEFGFRAFSFALIPQFVGVAGIVVFRDRVRRSLFSGVDDTPDYMHQRKLDIYRVALEETVRHGSSPDSPHLKELRLRHGITDQEHSIIAWMVSSEQGQAPGGKERFEVGQTVLDRYRLMRLLGQGTYGKTFLAYDNHIRTEVALKTVDLETFDGGAAKLLLREARLAATLDHPFIIDILDVAELSDRVVVVMEYANENLEQHLNQNGKLRLPAAVRFLRELLLALEAVHGKGILHRNLKPKNLLLEADGSLRLSDFGAAHSETSSGGEHSDYATQTLQDILYQAPEQLAGHPATPQSDLYVAGILFHEILTRRHPFPIAGKSDHSIRALVLASEPDLQVGRDPPWVRSFLLRALAADPAGRFRDATEMRETLEEAAGL